MQIREARAVPAAAPLRAVAGPLEPTRAAHEVVSRQARGVCRFLRVLGAPAAVADDLTQESFVVAWQKQKQGLPGPALGAFLRRTAKLLWLEYCRDRRREASAMAAVAERLWASECAADGGDAFVEAVRRCLQQLAPRARQALELVHAEECEREVVARQLGLLPNGLKMLLQRARQVVLECARRKP